MVLAAAHALLAVLVLVSSFACRGEVVGPEGCGGCPTGGIKIHMNALLNVPYTSKDNQTKMWTRYIPDSATITMDCGNKLNNHPNDWTQQVEISWTEWDDLTTEADTTTTEMVSTSTEASTTEASSSTEGVTTTTDASTTTTDASPTTTDAPTTTTDASTDLTTTTEAITPSTALSTATDVTSSTELLTTTTEGVTSTTEASTSTENSSTAETTITTSASTEVPITTEVASSSDPTITTTEPVPVTTTTEVITSPTVTEVPSSTEEPTTTEVTLSTDTTTITTKVVSTSPETTTITTELITTSTTRESTLSTDPTTTSSETDLTSTTVTPSNGETSSAEVVTTPSESVTPTTTEIASETTTVLTAESQTTVATDTTLAIVTGPITLPSTTTSLPPPVTPMLKHLVDGSDSTEAAETTELPKGVDEEMDDAVTDKDIYRQVRQADNGPQTPVYGAGQQDTKSTVSPILSGPNHLILRFKRNDETYHMNEVELKLDLSSANIADIGDYQGEFRASFNNLDEFVAPVKYNHVCENSTVLLNSAEDMYINFTNIKMAAFLPFENCDFYSKSWKCGNPFITKEDSDGRQVLLLGLGITLGLIVVIGLALHVYRMHLKMRRARSASGTIGPA